MKVETAMRMIATVFALIVFAAAARAGDRAGDFTHYVLALSWNASWCAIEGEERGAPQCDPREEIGFTLHGLWPQDEDGWPESCRTSEPDPSRAETAAMADIMGSAGLAWHEWKKHGRCSGLSPADYFALSRRAYAGIRQPHALERLDRRVRIDPDVVEEAFIEANPELDPDAVAVTCRDGLLQGVRICLTRELHPRACSAEVAPGCRADSVTLPPIR